MAVTTENIVDMLREVIELLKIDDDEKIELAIDVLTLVINVVGAQNIVNVLEKGVENAFESIFGLITGKNRDLSYEQRSEILGLTRSKLDDLFVQMDVLKSLSATESLQEV